MVRGVKSRIGDTRVAPNGYHYTKTRDGWQLTHRIIAARTLGRELKSNERTRFKDGDRTNLDPDNIEVFVTREKSKAARIAEIQAKIEDLQAELAWLENND